jgi:hypothetical protein
MAIELNHTIVHAIDPLVSATFLSEVLGLPPPPRFYRFWVLKTANRVSLDCIEAIPASTFKSTQDRSTSAPRALARWARCSSQA